MRHCHKLEYDRTKPLFDVVVRTGTLDTVRHSFVMQLLSRVNRGAVLIGECGTGTTTVVRCIALRNVVPFVIAVSAQTCSTQTQEMIESRGVWGSIR
jgi:hypothetical protein